jgi:hypothetical protein
VELADSGESVHEVAHEVACPYCGTAETLHSRSEHAQYVAFQPPGRVQ